MQVWVKKALSGCKQLAGREAWDPEGFSMGMVIIGDVPQRGRAGKGEQHTCVHEISPSRIRLTKNTNFSGHEPFYDSCLEFLNVEMGDMVGTHSLAVTAV